MIITKMIKMLLLVVLMTSVSGDQSALEVRRGDSDVIDDDGLHTLFACEGETLNMTCGRGRYVGVNSAMFGRAPVNHCVATPTTSSGPQSPCSESTRVLQVVKRGCEDERQWCSVEADRRLFLAYGMCVGVTTYLSVQFFCHPTVTSDMSVVVPAYTPAHRDVNRAVTLSSAVFCRSQAVRGVTWPDTPAHTWATAACPHSTGSWARWRCNKSGSWSGRPDFSNCVSSAMIQLQRRLSSFNETLNNETLRSVADRLLETSRSKQHLYGGDIDVLTDVMDDVVKRVDLVAMDSDSAATIHQLFQAVVATSDRLLSSSSSAAWQDLSTRRRSYAASRMLRTVERASLQFARTLNRDNSVSNVTNNIVVESAVLRESDQLMEDLQFPDVDSVLSSSWTSSHVTLPRNSALQLMRAQHGGGVLDYAFVMYKHIDAWLSPDVVNSNIVSVTTSVSLSHRINLVEPVILVLRHHHHQNNTFNAVCSFWKYYNTSSEYGDWSSEGCSLVDNNLTHTTCHCHHLTSFAILMSLTAPMVSTTDQLALTAITYVGCTMSIVCLAVAFLAFFFSRSVQGDRNTIHKNLVINLLVANLFFLTGISQTSIPVLCAVVAGFLHYFFLTSFAWMCLEGVQLYVMLVEVFEAEKSRVFWYYLAAYGVPAVIVGVSAAVGYHGYGTERHCWLSTDSGLIWSFIVPVVATLVVNTVLLGIAMYAMYKHSKMSALWRRERTTKQHFWSWIKGALVLEVLLGLTWAFGLAFVNDQTVVFAYVFTVVNSLQGTFIFVFHCVLNEKIRHDCQRAIRRMTCLPDAFRLKFGTARSTIVSTGQNQSNIINNNYLTKLLSRRPRRQSSSSSTLFKSNSSAGRRSGRDQENLPSVVKATDSGIEDTASYMEPSAIRLRESDFQQIDDIDGSLMEGSVVDTDYADCFATKTANGGAKRTVDEEEQLTSSQPESRK